MDKPSRTQRRKDGVVEPAQGTDRFFFFFSFFLNELDPGGGCYLLHALPPEPLTLFGLTT